MAQETIAESLLSLVSLHLGKYTADLYKELFAGKDEETCFQITRELLSEFMGEKNADEQLKSIVKQISF